MQIGDNKADVHLSDDSMIANYVSAQGGWDLVRGAQAANWVILLMGCPTRLTMPGTNRAVARELGRGRGRFTQPRPRP